MKRLCFFLILSSLFPGAFSQSLPKIGVLSLDVLQIEADPMVLGNAVRLQLMKGGGFEVIDRYDILEILGESGADPLRCYSKNCLMDLATKIGADKFISGSVERIGGKLLITLKMLDVKTATFEKVVVGEYMPEIQELERMITLTLNDLLGLPSDPDIKRNLEYYSSFDAAPFTRIINNGPRIGVGLFIGSVAERISAPVSEGGLDAYPVMSQMGFQYEVQYLNSGNFQALIENLWLITGLEQSNIIPSWLIMNGFRETKHGFEFGFGPSLSIRKVALGYFDNLNTWHREFEWSSPEPNPYPIVKSIDRRGNYELYTRFVWSVGKTFRSGYLNVPFNVYVSPRKGDWLVGAAIGFNLQKRRDSGLTTGGVRK